MIVRVSAWGQARARPTVAQTDTFARASSGAGSGAGDVRADTKCYQENLVLVSSQ